MRIFRALGTEKSAVKVTQAFEAQEGFLSTSEIDFLSGLYREAMADLEVQPDQDDIDRAVGRLAMMYRWGLRDRQMLIRAARILSNPAGEQPEP